MGQGMGCLSGVVNTPANGFDLGVLEYFKAVFPDEMSEEQKKKFYLIVKKEGVAADAPLEDRYEVRTTPEEIPDLRNARSAGARPETIFIPPCMGNSKRGYILFYPVDDGTCTIDVLNLDRPESMVDMCGKVCSMMAFGQIIDTADSTLSQDADVDAGEGESAGEEQEIKR